MSAWLSTEYPVPSIPPNTYRLLVSISQSSPSSGVVSPTSMSLHSHSYPKWSLPPLSSFNTFYLYHTFVVSLDDIFFFFSFISKRHFLTCETLNRVLQLHRGRKFSFKPSEAVSWLQNFSEPLTCSYIFAVSRKGLQLEKKKKKRLLLM